MKVEIELPDLEELYCTYEEEWVTGEDIKSAIANTAINKYIDQIYNDTMNDGVRSTFANEAKELIKNNSKEIIDRVVDRVSEEVLRKKVIMNEMPKKSEITGINKEWETYFVDLIDKAIAKRFR